MDSSQAHWMTVSELVSHYRARELSPVEVTEAMLARIGEMDPRLLSFHEVTAVRALAAAHKAEAAYRSGASPGPLSGVPVAVKALCDVKGARSSAGMRILRERIAADDATVVRRLEAAGAVLLGLLVMTEGASAVHHPDTPQPRNPWNPDFWAGASSSGSGVAVAAGLAFGAIGSDTAGSIRAPSHFSGVSGLKPTWGRVSRAGVFPLSPTLDHVGPMARSVADTAMMLEAIAGADPADPSAARRPAAECRPPEAGAAGLLIGVDERYIGDDVDPELAEAVLAAAAELEQAGARRVAIEVPDRSDALAAGAAILHSDVAWAHRELYPENAADYGPHLEQIISIGGKLSAVDLADAHERRRQWNGRLDALFDAVDLLILPPTPAPAPPVHLTHGLSGDFFDQSRFFRFTLPFTLSGHPALTMPCGFSRRGLPLGCQLVGRHFDEARACRAGMAYQQRTDWHRRHPDETAWRLPGA